MVLAEKTGDNRDGRIMGCDEVFCEWRVPFPKGYEEYRKSTFETKEFEGLAELYVITNRNYLAKAIRLPDDTWEERMEDYTGDIDLFTEDKDNPGALQEFVAHFEDGELKAIEHVRKWEVS